MKSVEFRKPGEEVTLRARLFPANEDGKRTPVVIMLTGDGPKGTKSLSWVNMPPRLAEVGIASWLFDFEGLGYSDGDRKNLSVSKGIKDLEVAYKLLTQQEEVDPTRIGAFASSFGANVLLVSPNIANRLMSIGLKSPASFLPDAYYREIGDDQFEMWRKEGYLEENGYEFSVFLDSLKYNAYASASEIRTPCLITQGDADEVIPVQHSKYLYECLGSINKRLEIFPGSGHGYSEEGAWDRMAQMFVEWFADTLL